MTEKLRGMEDRRNSFSIFRISEGENRMNERETGRETCTQRQK